MSQKKPEQAKPCPTMITAMTDNPYYPKRFLTLDSVLKREFGTKVVKIPLNAGLGCPNRDGFKGSGGCIYCSSRLSGEFAGDPKKSLERQFEETKRLYYNKWGITPYIPYLQAGTNTYAPIDVLREIYEAALSLPGAVGLSIATRADCISEETAELLANFSKRTYLTVELGLQSSDDKTARIINRCHSFEDFLVGYNRLKARNIRTCIHIINGLPGEDRSKMLKTAADAASLEPYEMKIHLLHIISGTPAEGLWRSGKIRPLEKDEYIGIVCDQLELISPDTAIGRLTGDGDRATLLAPLWSKDKRSVLNGIDKEMARRQSIQGIYFRKALPPQFTQE